VKSLSMLITGVAGCLEKKFRRLLGKCTFECDVASHISETFERIFDKCLVVGCLVFTKKVVSNCFQSFPSISFSPFEQCIEILILNKIITLRTNDDSFFVLDSLIYGNYCCRY
jgi:hypothetical protein